MWTTSGVCRRRRRRGAYRAPQTALARRWSGSPWRDPELCGPGFPFDVLAVADVEALSLDARVTLLAGENGSGKSTLVEAIAAALGLAEQGGELERVGALPAVPRPESGRGCGWAPASGAEHARTSLSRSAAGTAATLTRSTLSDDEFAAEVAWDDHAEVKATGAVEPTDEFVLVFDFGEGWRHRSAVMAQ
jgi:hypothetical protein